jgi:hypothetical protein
MPEVRSSRWVALNETFFSWMPLDSEDSNTSSTNCLWLWPSSTNRFKGWFGIIREEINVFSHYLFG